MLPQTSTKITFPGGSIAEDATLLFCKAAPGDATKILLFSDVTPFHPLDYNWPDQPGDKGRLLFDGKVISIIDCLTAAFNPNSAELLLDQEIKVRKIKRDDANWLFLVAHVIKRENLTEFDLAKLSDKKIKLEVDANYRLALSRSHTASHFAAVALNKICARFWQKKSLRLDSLDNPDFDGSAIVSSRITEECSTDQYHCGKSLRKLGFDCNAFFVANELKQIESEINKQLVEWCFFGLTISMTPAIANLNQKRIWSCILPDGKTATIPCGGTHVLQTLPGDKVVISLQTSGEQDFVITSQMV